MNKLKDFYYTIMPSFICEATHKLGDKLFDLKAQKQRFKKGYANTDVWNFRDWFTDTVAKMLSQLKENHMGFPTKLEKDYIKEHKELGLTYAEFVIWPDKEKDPEGYNLRSEVTDICSKQWEEILERMIFLLNEMDEDTCSRQNKYEAELDRAREDFNKQFGLRGEKLLTEAEKKYYEEHNVVIYKGINYSPIKWHRDAINNYCAEMKKQGKYMNKCKDEFFKLFSKWFWDLWD